MSDDCPNCEQCDCNPNDFDDVQFAQQVNEEAHYYHVLNEFEELLKEYGARKVFGDLGTDKIIQITKELSSE
jgi:methionyl-tRNA synthetase